MPYVELHAHSAFSFLDGTALPEELAAAAAERGYGTFALTDHDNVCGAMEFAQAAPSLGLRPLHGAEMTLDDDRHLTLLVEDAVGWRNLSQLLTRAHAHTRDRRDRRAEQPAVALDDVLEHAGGLVCLSGCATHGVDDLPTGRRLLDAFGAERLRIELQRPFLTGDRARNRARAALARRLGVRTVATGNVHAHTRVRAYLQDAFVAIRHGTTLDACGDGVALRRPPRGGDRDRGRRRAPEL